MHIELVEEQRGQEFSSSCLREITPCGSRFVQPLIILVTGHVTHSRDRADVFPQFMSPHLHAPASDGVTSSVCGGGARCFQARKGRVAPSRRHAAGRLLHRRRRRRQRRPERFPAGRPSAGEACAAEFHFSSEPALLDRSSTDRLADRSTGSKTR